MEAGFCTVPSKLLDRSEVPTLPVIRKVSFMCHLQAAKLWSLNWLVKLLWSGPPMLWPLGDTLTLPKSRTMDMEKCRNGRQIWQRDEFSPVASQYKPPQMIIKRASTFAQRKTMLTSTEALLLVMFSTQRVTAGHREVRGCHHGEW